MCRLQYVALRSDIELKTSTAKTRLNDSIAK